MSNRASILSTVLANPIQQAGDISRLLPGRSPPLAVEEAIAAADADLGPPS